MHFFKLTQPLTYFYSTKEEKLEKSERKPYSLPYGLRNLRNLKSKNYQEYAQKPQGNGTFMNSASAVALVKVSENSEKRALLYVGFGKLQFLSALS
jgi:hypothetical protein